MSKDDEEKYAAAMAMQASGSGALSAQIGYNQATQYVGSGFTNDIHCRSTALEVAMRLSKPGDAFPDVIGKARAIYAFLIDQGSPT